MHRRRRIDPRLRGRRRLGDRAGPPAELAPTERRGALTGRNELAIVVGQLLAFVINAIIGNVWGEHDGRLARSCCAVAAIPAVALFVGDAADAGVAALAHLRRAVSPTRSRS